MGPLPFPDVSRPRKQPGLAAPQFLFLPRLIWGAEVISAGAYDPRTLPAPHAPAWLPAKSAAAAQVTRSWKATLAAGRGRLLEARRRRLHLKRRRLGVRGPEARSGAGQRGAASPLRGTGAQQRRLELHGPFQCRPARHPAEGPETRRRRGSKGSPEPNSSATAPKPSRLQWRLRHPAAALAPPPVTSRACATARWRGASRKRAAPGGPQAWARPFAPPAEEVGRSGRRAWSPSNTPAPAPPRAPLYPLCRGGLGGLSHLRDRGLGGGWERPGETRVPVAA